MSTLNRFPRLGARSGMVAVQVALSLTALTGIVAIAADGGILLAERRHAQATADAAALSSASALFLKSNTNGGLDDGTALQSAIDTATANGYKNDAVAGNGSSNAANTSTVNIQLNPNKYLGGPNAGTTVPKGYAEVTVTYYQGRYFSTVFGGGTIPISARAVARGLMAQDTSPAVLILDPSGSGALTDDGGGSGGGMIVSGGSVVVNSSSSTAITTHGHPTVTAQKFVVAGGYGSSTLVTSPTPGQITTGAAATADPLAYLPAPSQPANGEWYIQGGNYYIPPGAYGVTGGDKNNDLTKIPNNATVYFVQAGAGLGSIIYVVSGGFSSNNSTYEMDPITSGGIMIYGASSGGISLGGNSGSSFNLSPLTSGIYKGISYFQARNSTGNLDLGGNGTINVTGTIYAPNASATFSGNGSSNVVGSQLIVKDLTLNGNGFANVDYSPNSSARLREFQLVE